MRLLLLELPVVLGLVSPSFPFWDAAASRPTMQIGLVTPLTRHGCGPSRYVAQRLAANHITLLPRDSSLCPAIADLQHDFQIAYDLYDSNANGKAGTSAVLRATGMGNGVVKVILGPNSSGTAKATSTVLSVFGIPQLSWAATNADLSNKDQYPQFFRVVPPDSVAMEQLVRTVQFFGYARCFVLFFDADLPAGQARDFQSAAGAHGLEVVGVARIPSSGDGGAAVSVANQPVMLAALDSV